MRFGIDAGTRWPHPGRPAQLCMMAQASRFPFYIDDGASRRRPAMRARGLSSEARVPGPSDRLASTSLISVNAWSKIVIARSISSRVTVNGGAIRHRPALGPTANVHAEPELQASLGRSAPSAWCGSRVSRSRTSSIPRRSPCPARRRFPRDGFAGRAVPWRGSRPWHDFAQGDPPARSSRARRARRWRAAGPTRATCRTRSPARDTGFDVVRRDHAGKRNAAAERLRHGHDVGSHFQVRRGEPVSQPAERRLRFVEDQQHAALERFLPQRFEIALRRNDDAAGADHRLGDHCGTCARRLRVVQLEADLHAGAVAPIAAMPDGTAIRIGPAARRFPALPGRSPCDRSRTKPSRRCR